MYIQPVKVLDRQGRPRFVPHKMVIKPVVIPKRIFGKGHCRCPQRGGNIFSDIGSAFSSAVDYVGDVASDPLRAGLALGTFGISEATGLGRNLRDDPLRAIAAASTGGVTELGLAASRGAERVTGMKGTALLDKATPGLVSVLGPEVAMPIKVISTIGKQLGGKKRRKKAPKKKAPKKKPGRPKKRGRPRKKK